MSDDKQSRAPFGDLSNFKDNHKSPKKPPIQSAETAPQSETKKRKKSDNERKTKKKRKLSPSESDSEIAKTVHNEKNEDELVESQDKNEDELLKSQDKNVDPKERKSKRSCLYDNKAERVGILYTGGTFGCRGSPLSPAPMDNVKKLVKEKTNCSHICDWIPVLNENGEQYTIDSSAANPLVWVTVSKIIENESENYCGFVVIHGTDTLAYAGAFLSAMLPNLEQPVIITGSMTPLVNSINDAVDNISCSIGFAYQKFKRPKYQREKFSKSRIPGVFVFFNKNLYIGSDILKMNAYSWDSFISVSNPIGTCETYPELIIEKVQIEHLIQKVIEKSPYEKNHKLESYTQLGKVKMLSMNPSLEETDETIDECEDLLKICGDSDGFILEAYGTGNGSVKVYKTLKKLADNGVIVAVTSQCPISGNGDTYEAGLCKEGSPFISLTHMTPISAYAQMVVLIGRGLSKEKIIEQLTGRQEHKDIQIFSPPNTINKYFKTQ